MFYFDWSAALLEGVKRNTSLATLSLVASPASHSVAGEASIGAIQVALKQNASDAAGAAARKAALPALPSKRVAVASRAAKIATHGAGGSANLFLYAAIVVVAAVLVDNLLFQGVAGKSLGYQAYLAQLLSTLARAFR